jgi:hypothetical protein
MSNDKPLKPDDFPVEVEGDELMTADGKPIAPRGYRAWRHICRL